MPATAPRLVATLCLGLASALSTGLASAQTAPSTDWRTANDTVGRFLRGHIDWLRWERSQPSANSATAESVRAVATPASPLGLDELLTRALALRPDLLAVPGMGVQELRALDAQWAQWRHSVHIAWTEAVLAEGQWQWQQRVLEGSEAGDELAQRMADVGNWSQAQRLEQALALGRAQAETQKRALAADHAWRRLATLGGLDANTLPARRHGTLPVLPDLASSPLWQASAQQMQETALARHPDWPALQAEAQRLTAGLGRGWDSWQAQASQLAREALQMERAPRIDPRQVRWSHALEKAVNAQAQAAALQAQIRDQVHSARAQLSTSHALALQAQTALKREVAMEQETLLRYNGMFKSTWELIAGAQSRLAAEAAAQAALADFWRAHADLQALLAGAPYAGPAGLTDGSAPAASPKGH